MESTDIYLEHDKVFVLENGALIEADYDRLQVGRAYFVITKTNRFSIYKKSENFDDEFLKIEDEKSRAEEYLKSVMSE